MCFEKCFFSVGARPVPRSQRSRVAHPGCSRKISTAEPFSISVFQHLTFALAREVLARYFTGQHLRISAFQHFHNPQPKTRRAPHPPRHPPAMLTPPLQRFNAPTLQRFNDSTIQPIAPRLAEKLPFRSPVSGLASSFNDSTIQRFNRSHRVPPKSSASGLTSRGSRASRTPFSASRRKAHALAAP
jgi:hypothetical protein